MASTEQSPGLRLSLTGKVALVTGGSRGIGAATVRLLHQAGARVVFSYRAAKDRALALAAECGGDAHCRALRQDLNTLEDGHALVAAATAAWGRLDILIVNHGIWPSRDQPIATMSAAQWRTTLGTNLDSVFGLIQSATAQMLSQPLAQPATTSVISTEGAPAPKRRDPCISKISGSLPAPRGHIILIASTAAQRGEAFHADYAASKGALVSLTKSLSTELAPQGILCNCIAPGWVKTDMSAGTLSDPITSKKALAPIPLGRAAEPDEIAGPIVFLCTPFAGFISGEVWNINGGAVLIG